MLIKDLKELIKDLDDFDDVVVTKIIHKRDMIVFGVQGGRITDHEDRTRLVLYNNTPLEEWPR